MDPTGCCAAVVPRAADGTYAVYAGGDIGVDRLRCAISPEHRVVPYVRAPTDLPAGCGHAARPQKDNLEKSRVYKCVRLEIFLTMYTNNYFRKEFEAQAAL